MFKKKIAKILNDNKIFPADSKIIIKDLGMGENNLNYLIMSGKQKYVFRICIKKYLEKNFCKEFKFLKHIPKNLSPRPLYLDKTKKLLPYYYSILKYVEGNSYVLWNRKKLKLHAHAMAKLHAKVFSYWVTTGKKRKRFSLYKKFIYDINTYKNISFTNKQKILVKKFRLYIQKNDHYFTELKKFHFIHGDLCADNILFKKGSIKYIDWEWCGIRDNAEDLAKVYINDNSISPWYISLNNKEIDFMITEYSKTIKDSTLRKRVDIWNNYGLFMDMIFQIWKIKNFQRFASKLPKQHYVKASKQLFNHFSIKFKY